MNYEGLTFVEVYFCFWSRLEGVATMNAGKVCTAAQQEPFVLPSLRQVSY